MLVNLKNHVVTIDYQTSYTPHPKYNPKQNTGGSARKLVLSRPMTPRNPAEQVR
jgi:hypothetical protein